MDPLLSNLLYDDPALYEAVYPTSEKEIPAMAERLFAEHSRAGVRTLLDFGCGTGRHVEYFTGAGMDCVGVDYQDAMVSFARLQRPGHDFRVGDMRTVRLGRTFDAVTCLGWAISNIHANEDLARVVATFAAHSAPGTLLFLHVPNAIAGPEGHGLQQHFTIDTPGFTATADATYTLEHRTQLLTRERVWHIAGRPPHRDHVRFRLLFPMELELLLAGGGFTVLGMYDNTAARPGDPTGPALYVLARFDGARTDRGSTAPR